MIFYLTSFWDCVEPGMLACGEVFLFGIAGSEKLCAAYNVRTREVQWIQLEKSASKCHPKPHVNSMVWLEQ